MIGQAFHWANLTVAFLLELCALAALGYWGFRTASGPAAKAALGIGAPLLAAVLWGLFAAPRAPVSIPLASGGGAAAGLRLGRGSAIRHRPARACPDLRRPRRRKCRPGEPLTGRDRPRSQHRGETSRVLQPWRPRQAVDQPPS
jgi:hypothetical protein